MKANETGITAHLECFGCGACVEVVVPPGTLQTIPRTVSVVMAVPLPGTWGLYGRDRVACSPVCAGLGDGGGR